MQTVLEKIYTMVPDICGKILLAIVVFIVGKIIVNLLVKLIKKSKLLHKAEEAVQTFILSFVKIGLNVILFISVIGILGVPMASIIAVLASASVAVGLALQGALTNLAGGIMLIIFKPFHVGNYVECSGAAGTVREITLFYTVFVTPDNKVVTVPNGSLMNSNVTNYSLEPTRRIDITFTVAKSEAPERICEIIRSTAAKCPEVLKDPAPFANVCGGSNEGVDYVCRVWCSNADYWTVYNAMYQSVTEALGAAGVETPAIRILSDRK